MIINKKIMIQIKRYQNTGMDAYIKENLKMGKSMETDNLFNLLLIIL